MDDTVLPFLGGDSVMLLVAPQGFEPRLNESESSVLPLNEGGNKSASAHLQRAMFPSPLLMQVLLFRAASGQCNLWIPRYQFEAASGCQRFGAAFALRLVCSRCILCCPTRMNPVRWGVSSRTRESTIATVNGDTSIARKKRRLMLYPTTKQLSTAIRINTNQMVLGMRVHRPRSVAR